MNDPANYVSPRETSPFARFQLHPSHLTTSIPGEAMNPGTYLTSDPKVDDVQARSVMWLVAEHSANAAEARETLGMLLGSTLPGIRCEAGCGCRYGTSDPDDRECDCTGPCTTLPAERWGWSQG